MKLDAMHASTRASQDRICASEKARATDRGAIENLHWRIRQAPLNSVIIEDFLDLDGTVGKQFDHIERSAMDITSLNTVIAGYRPRTDNDGLVLLAVKCSVSCEHAEM